MHELSITQSILDISLKAAQAQHARRIRTIRLTIGPFSGVVGAIKKEVCGAAAPGKEGTSHA